MSFSDHFSEKARQYATARPTYPHELAAFLGSVAAQSDRAWEAGCGSGQLTRDLAGYFNHIAAIDPSYAQLQHAPRLPGVTYHCALAEASSLAGDSVDICIAAQAAHWFDLDRFYDEVRRVSHQDGVIALMSYGVNNIGPGVDEVVSEFHFNTLRGYWPPERSHVDANYETLPFPFEPLPTPAITMSVTWTVDEFIGYAQTWSGVQALQKREGDEKVRAFIEQLRVVWGDPTKPRQVSWPLGLKVGRVHS